MAKPTVDVEGSSAQCKDGRLSILLTAGTGQFNLVTAAMERIATSTSPRALSNWAFFHGALSVSHNYDLRLSPDR